MDCPAAGSTPALSKGESAVGTSGITFTMGPDTRAVAWWWKTWTFMAKGTFKQEAGAKGR